MLSKVVVDIAWSWRGRGGVRQWIIREEGLDGSTDLF